MAPDLPDLRTCKKIGFIVPSSNTVVEPYCNAIVQSLNANIICLYTRIAVKKVGTDASSTSQFSTETMVNAAKLLADAECDAILWNGTSGMWVGTRLEADEALAKAMQDATVGIPCSTTTLATVNALRHHKIKTIALAVPYTEALTSKLVDFFASCGFNVERAERLAVTPKDNLAIGKCKPSDVREVIWHCVDGQDRNSVDAVVVACTNWPGAGFAEEFEMQWGALLVDSIAVTVWQALQMTGFRVGATGWGRLLAENR